jgi:small nuclear ribonucleoprotein (snRNP)-like protein
VISAHLRLHTPSFFKTLIDHEVTVELKNDIQLRGTLKSVDQYLNIKLDDITVVEELKYPHLVKSVPPLSLPEPHSTVGSVTQSTDAYFPPLPL